MRYSFVAVRMNTLPAAIVTIIVSPMAREMPSTNDATMPDRAAGTTTREMDAIFSAAPPGYLHNFLFVASGSDVSALTPAGAAG